MINMTDNDIYGQQKLTSFFPEIIPQKTFEPLKTTREERGKQIAESFGNMRRIDPDTTRLSDIPQLHETS
jgi:hypothetical protein